MFQRVRPALLSLLAGLVATTVLVAATPISSQRPIAQRPLRSAPLDTAVFAGGCFWGIEGVFEHLKGVSSATAGYAGGTTVSPFYEDVSSGTTGHAESVQIVYDPARISYAQLLQVFFSVAHDPTELNRQGPDVGAQYRSAIFYRNTAQQKAATDYIADLTARKAYSHPIVTQVVPLKAFYMAEGYHQHYMTLHPDQPYIVYNDAPKVAQLKQKFASWYQEGR